MEQVPQFNPMSRATSGNAVLCPCPSCLRLLRIDVSHVGKPGRCTCCGTIFELSPPNDGSIVFRLLDFVTRGRYSQYKQNPLVVKVEHMRALLRHVDTLSNTFGQANTNVKGQMASIWSMLRSRQIASELQGRPLSELKAVSGVGQATIRKLSDMGIANLADLTARMSLVEQMSHTNAAAKQSLKAYALGAQQAAQSRPVRLDPQNSDVQRVIGCALKKDSLEQTIDQIRSVADKCRLYDWVVSSKPSFLAFLTGNHHLNESMVNGAARYLEREIASINDLELPGETNVNDLSQDDYIRALGLVNNQFDVGTGVGVRGSKTSGSRHDNALLAQIQELKLDTSRMKNCILRRYQEFGAKFMLVRKHVLLGDEMGLGKTIQILAVCSHMSASIPQFRSLIIVPASLRDNWRTEIQHKTHLKCHMLVGWPLREKIAAWQAEGGIGIVSYNVLQGSIDLFTDGVRALDLCVADEAQYIKNPSAKRSHAAQRFLFPCPIAVAMTGTPIENHPREFLAIASSLNHRVGAVAHLARSDAIGTPDYFQRAVETIYLRRNKEDVLTELPELIEIEERVSFDREMLAAHLGLIEQGTHFMGLRQHAIFGNDTNSPKLDRVMELLEHYSERREKVVVFSFFRRVLDDLSGSCQGAYMLHGGIPTATRTATINEFSMTSSRGHVLLAQIDAGGVGLNLQAASAVIIVEPQLNPAREYQAISRVHRMGQRRSVNVHRLLSQQTIEEAIVAMLARKRKFMDDYARESLLKQSTEDAISKEEISQIVEFQRKKLNEILRVS